MTLPVSGAISFNNINVELGVSGTTQASLGQASYRTLAGVASGAISMSNFYGKANAFSFAIASNVAQADLRTLALSAGWNGTSQLTCTINAGVTVYSNSTGSAAFTVSGSFPNGVALINNGTILGRGGTGGNGAPPNGSGGTGSSGGLALSVAAALTVTNNGRISGGGGGGGGGKGGTLASNTGGGGGGGGIGNGPGGAAGSGGNTAPASAGGSGTLTTAGGGGSGAVSGTSRGGPGGAGGSYGSSGSAGGLPPSGGGSGSVGGAGGAGSCTLGNANITWLVVGTRNGALN